jgi:DMSO/TMAO reductase YedYZ heme-binding membrane subunit
MAMFTFLSVFAAQLYLPLASWGYRIMLAMGYLSLVLVSFTLMFGTVKLFWNRRNPVNLNVRRDMGIWAGFSGIVHVVLGFGVYSGTAILPYYVRWADDGAVRPLTSLFGFNNYVGTLASVILVMLLLTSNNVSLIWLRGKRWKALQRWNYALAVLAFAHTFGYQHISHRAPVFLWMTLIFLVFTIVAQGVGYRLMQR